MKWNVDENQWNGCQPTYEEIIENKNKIKNLNEQTLDYLKEILNKIETLCKNIEKVDRDFEKLKERYK